MSTSLFVVYKFVLHGKQFLAKQTKGLDENISNFRRVYLCGGWVPAGGCVCALNKFSFNKFSYRPSSTQVHPAKIGTVLVCSPCLFGKKLFSMQDKLVNNKQTHLLKQNFSETITPIDKSCMLLFNLSINSVVC